MTEGYYILKTTQLAIGYTAQLPILEDIQMKIPKGKLIGLIGVNGSGKSTLIRTLSGLQHPLKGIINIEDRSITTYKLQDLARFLSVVLTGQHLSQNLTVNELVALGRQPYTGWMGTLKTIDKEIIQNALLATETQELGHRKCHTLSDGQLQRALIARAIAQDTPLILMDEPLSHLDLHHQAALLKLLQTITRQYQKTIIFSSHEIGQILPLCDQLILLKEGELVYDETEKLIDEGVFDTLFPTDHIVFDRKNLNFTIRT